MSGQVFTAGFFGSKQPPQGGFLEQTASVWKMALGSIIAWELAGLTGSKHPYLAPLTLILCLQVTIGQSLRFALYRTVGTVAGVLMIAGFAKDIPVTGWSLALILFLSAALMKVLNVSDKVIHQAALSILFVLYFEHHSAGYAFDRIKDTLIGSLTAVLFVTLILPPDPSKGAETSVQNFTADLANEMENTSSALQLHQLTAPGQALAPSLNTLFSKLNQIEQALQQAREGSALNPYDSPTLIQNLKQRVDALKHACIHFATLAEILSAWSVSEQLDAATRQEWSKALGRMAAAIRTWKSELMKSDSAVDLTIRLPKANPLAQQPPVPDPSASPDPAVPSETLASPWYGQLASYHAQQLIKSLHLNWTV